MVQSQQSGDMLTLIRKFAAAENFRSAVVDELELDGDFYRRPLRPEDLAFIDFEASVAADTICDLPSLAAQRILRCIYDLQIARLPRSPDLRGFGQRNQFYSDASRITAAQLIPFLEHFAFSFLEQPVDWDVSQEEMIMQFAQNLRDATSFARVTRARFLQGDFAKVALRFLMVQKWCLGATKHIAIAGAQVRGYFDFLAPEDWPQNWVDREDNHALTCLATEVDVNRDPHAFWQFYLSTSLAETNYLSALATRPELSFALVGASFVAEAEWRSFGWLARQSCQDLGLPVSGIRSPGEEERVTVDLTQRFARALSTVEKLLGIRGRREVFRGVAVAMRLSQLSRLDLETQLRWLGSMDDYTESARQIVRRIQSERPNIDRETFVEPREMCSTTHVHNDHRLVVVESGDMVFWGRPGMRLQVKSGDVILVPRGRLHGSTVESDECVYHQPIIPEEWVRPLIAEVDRRHGWPTQNSEELCRSLQN